MALMTCTLHNISYNDKLDPTCPQCTLAGIHVEGTQVKATPGEAGAPLPEQ